MLSIRPGNQLDSVEEMEAGERIDSSGRQHFLRLTGYVEENSWGRSSVGQSAAFSDLSV
jgi:hypothetical protein